MAPFIYTPSVHSVLRLLLVSNDVSEAFVLAVDVLGRYNTPNIRKISISLGPLDQTVSTSGTRIAALYRGLLPATEHHLYNASSFIAPGPNVSGSYTFEVSTYRSRASTVPLGSSTIGHLRDISSSNFTELTTITGTVGGSSSLIERP